MFGVAVVSKTNKKQHTFDWLICLIVVGSSQIAKLKFQPKSRHTTRSIHPHLV
jgi:hypothetical protein